MENVPILYINLARSKERRERMEKQFARVGITNYSRIDAVDGKDLYASPKQLAEMVDLPANTTQSPGEIGCSLSHIRAAERVLDLGLQCALIMEDDIHLTYYDKWHVTLMEIIAMAPRDWTVLQLTINNVRVIRTLIGLGIPFVRWRKNHWSTGAYVINRAGCERCVREYKDGMRYRLPEDVQLVSDVLMFNGTGTYTFTRPLFDHEIKESTIHQAHVESCHRHASELVACFYERFDMIWAGGDDSRVAIVASLSELAREDQRARLRWWIDFHLRIGFRWLLLYVDDDLRRRSIATDFKWSRESVILLSHPLAESSVHGVIDNSVVIEATARARLAGASWLLQLFDYDLFYVLPGRSLKSVFDEASLGCGCADDTDSERVLSLLFDTFEAQKSANITNPSAFDSTYNFFECEVLFKCRRDHVDGSPISRADDHAYYEFTPGSENLEPDKPANSGPAAVHAVAFLGGTEGRSAGRLAERGLAPCGIHRWQSSNRNPEHSADSVVSKRAFVLTYQFCHFEAWRRSLQAQFIMRGHHSPTNCSARCSQDTRADVTSAFAAASEVALAAARSKQDPRIAQNFYANTVLLPLDSGTNNVCQQIESGGDAEKGEIRVHLALPTGCVRSDCGGAYLLINNRHCQSGLYRQQDGLHHMYRISTPFVAWMVGRTPYSSTAALVSHDLATRPQDIRAPWSAYDGRRWSSIPSAYVRLEQHVAANGGRYAVICPSAVVKSEVDTIRSLLPPPPPYNPNLYCCLNSGGHLTTESQLQHFTNLDCWQTSGQNGDLIETFLTAEQAETAVRAAARRRRRASFEAKVKDCGAIVVDLPATCGAAAEACAGVYIPHLKAISSDNSTPPLEGIKPTALYSVTQVEKWSSSKVYRHEEGAHYLYFYAPFSAWMIGSRPGSGSAALIAYDGADSPELILPNAPWRVYDGRAWREVSEIRIHSLADATSNKGLAVKQTAICGNPNVGTQVAQQCTLEELPIYPWTPKVEVVDHGDQVTSNGRPQSAGRSRKYMIYTCAGDRAVIPFWLQNGQRHFDLWVTYYGHADEDRWRAQADIFRRRQGGKFENLQALWREQHVADILKSYDAIMVIDDDVIIDAPRINKLFQLRQTHRLLCLQPAFETRGKISHAITAVQPGNRLRLTNFVEMTCPLFATNALVNFLERFDPALKGWGADWWFLTVVAQAGVDHQKNMDTICAATPSTSLRGLCAVVDAVTCINPTDSDKGGLREINILQGREQRRAIWEVIRRRENIHEWNHLEFGAVWLTADGQPDVESTLALKSSSKPLRIRGCRPYEKAPTTSYD